MASNGRAGSIPAPSTITYTKVYFKCLTKNFKTILLPLNFKTSKSIALSIVKIDQFYSIKPCTIVNGFGMDEIDSSFIFTEADENSFSPIPVFDFDEKFDTTGEDLLICLEEVLAKLKDEFN